MSHFPSTILWSGWKHGIIFGVQRKSQLMGNIPALPPPPPPPPPTPHSGPDLTMHYILPLPVEVSSTTSCLQMAHSTHYPSPDSPPWTSSPPLGPPPFSCCFLGTPPLFLGLLSSSFSSPLGPPLLLFLLSLSDRPQSPFIMNE